MRLPLVLAAVMLAAAGPSRADDFDPSLQSFRFHAAGAAPQAAPAAAHVDLSDEFPTAVDYQGRVGSCHTFSAVAVVEAALYRRHQRHFNISEADLFIRDKIHASGTLGDYARASLYADYIRDGANDTSEGLALLPDVQYLLANGAATEASLPYARFEARYAEQVKPALKAAMAKADKELAVETRGDGVDRAQQVAVGNGDRLTAAQVDRAALVQTRLGPVLRRTLDDFLAKEFPAAAADRLNIRGLLAGFTPVTETFPRDFSATTLEQLWPGRYKPEQGKVLAGSLIGPDCEALGLAQAAFLKKHLDARRPVAVGFQLDGMPEWDRIVKRVPGKHNFHGVVIDGYETRDGQVYFTTRNSWGAKEANIPFRRDQLCRIHQMLTVLAPGER